MAQSKSPLLFHKADIAEQAVCLLLNRMGGFRYIRYFFKAVSRLGDGVFWYSLMLALPLFHGLLGLQLMGHIVIWGLVSVGLYKLLKGKLVRERPFISFSNIQAHTLPLDKYSFPSGHTMNAVNFAIMFCWFFPQLFWIVVPFALLVGLSRIVLGMHYPTDVIVGAALGALIAWASTSLWPEGMFTF